MKKHIMKEENYKYYHLEKGFTKIKASDRLPGINTSLAIQPATVSFQVFIMTDNGHDIGYYDYEEAEWKSQTGRNNWAYVVYWLEENK